MTIKEKIETHFGVSIKEVITRLHWEEKISINELSKQAGVIRQSFQHVLRTHGLKWRSVREATELTKNKGANHWGYGKTKHTNKYYKKHSERMLRENPAHNPESAAKMAIGRAKIFKKSPWPQEKLFSKMLYKCKIEFIFQYPIGPYVIDFFIPKINLCIEIDTTDKWDTSKYAKAKVKDLCLEEKGFYVLRINKRFLLTPDKVLNILKTNNVISD